MRLVKTVFVLLFFFLIGNKFSKIEAIKNSYFQNFFKQKRQTLQIFCVLYSLTLFRCFIFIYFLSFYSLYISYQISFVFCVFCF